MKVRFFNDYTVNAQDGEKYVAGQIYDMSVASANHFINRGVAVQMQDSSQVQDSIKSSDAQKGKK